MMNVLKRHGSRLATDNSAALWSSPAPADAAIDEDGTSASASAASTGGVGFPHSRRQFLYGAAAGAVSMGAVGAVIAPAGAVNRTDHRAGGAAAAGPNSSSEPIVAVLRNPGTGEFALLCGEREVVVYDKALAATFARAVADTSNNRI